MYKVMVVEDEDFLREILHGFLSLEGYECRVAGNGAEALAILAEEPFDAVITDVMMPEMDGITMLKELASRHFRQPVLVMTGGGGIIDNRNAALRAGARGFVAKPFSPRELLAEFDRMMQQAPGRPDMTEQNSRL